MFQPLPTKAIAFVVMLTALLGGLSLTDGQSRADAVAGDSGGATEGKRVYFYLDDVAAACPRILGFTIWNENEPLPRVIPRDEGPHLISVLVPPGSRALLVEIDARGCERHLTTYAYEKWLECTDVRTPCRYEMRPQLEANSREPMALPPRTAPCMCWTVGVTSTDDAARWCLPLVVMLAAWGRRRGRCPAPQGSGRRCAISRGRQANGQ